MKITALVTLYKPDSSVRNNIESLLKQVTNVILLDNTELIDNSELFNNLNNCTYILNEKNLGLSSAFNKVLCNDSNIKQSDYIIFFDQDSCVTDNFIKKLINDYNKISEINKIGCLGAVYYDSVKKEYGGFSRIKNEICDNCYEVPELITSALITKYSTLEAVGFWNENIFLDYADYDLCWRLNKAGYHIFITKNAILNHSLGTGTIKIRILWKQLNVSYSPPLREYYQTREAIKLLFKFYVPIRWKKNFLFNLFIRIFIFCFKLENGKERYYYYLKGFKDGILKRNGEYTVERR